MAEEERAKLMAPEEWAQKEPAEGPHYVVVGMPEDCAEWPELALPWRIAETPEQVHTPWGEWAYSPTTAGEKWALVRWNERWDCAGPVPITIRALVTHSDGRQWQVEAEIIRVVDCLGRATPIDVRDALAIRPDRP